MDNSWQTYFDQTDEVKIYAREEVENIADLDYIIVESMTHANEVTKEYNTTKNDIQIICIDQKTEIRNFLLSNGRLCISEHFLKSPLGYFLLDKFLQRKSSIHLLENHGETIEDYHDFKVTNHLNTGEVIDELSVNAFEKGFKLVPIRSYIDHTIYYLTYLKQAGLAGIPFEFEYGFSEHFMAINVHATVKNFVAEYMIDSFGKMNSDDPLKYLLGVMAHACDFLDLTHVENPSKLILTGYFNKGAEHKVSGIAFNNIKTTSQIISEVEDRVSGYRPQKDKTERNEKRVEDLGDKSLAGGLLAAVQPPPAGSVLAEKPATTEEVITFLIDNFEKAYPDRELSEFDRSNLNQFIAGVSDIDFVERLTDEDKDYLVERIQKFNLSKAYDEEIKSIREEIANDAFVIQEFKDTMNEEVAKKISDHIDTNLLNEILAKDEDTSAVRKEKTSHVEKLPQFSVDDAFETLDSSFAGASGNFDASSVVDGLDLGDGKDDFAQNIAGGDEDLFQNTTVPSFDVEEDVFSDLFESDVENSFAQKITGTSGLGDENSRVGGTFEEIEPTIKIGGGPDDAESATMVKGGKEVADDFLQKIKGMPSEPEDDFVQAFSNSFNDSQDKGLFNFKTSNVEDREKEVKRFVKNTLDTSEKLTGLEMSVKAFVHKEAPKRINQGLEHYASRLGKTLENLSQDDMTKFNNEVFPGLLAEVINDEDQINEFKKDLEGYFNNLDTGVESSGLPNTSPKASVFEAQFKVNLERKLEDYTNVSKEDDKYVIEDNSMSESDMQSLIQETMKETFDAAFTFDNATPEEIEKKEKQIISELSQTLKMPEDDVTTIVKGASEKLKEKEQQIVAEKVFGEQTFDEGVIPPVENSEGYTQVTNTKGEAALIEKLKNSEDENKRLKTELSAMELKLSMGDDVKDKFEEVMDELANEDLSDSGESTVSSSLNKEEKEELLAKLSSDENLDPDIADKLKKSIEKESEVVELAKQAEAHLRKAQLESEKKDTLFKTELAKAQKTIKAKELVLEKAKSSMKNLVQKKEKEMVELRAQVNNLNQKLNNDQSAQLKTQVLALKNEKESLTRTAEVYKGKLEAMAKNVEAKKNDDNSAAIAEENRNLKNLKTQLENKMNSEAKTRKSLEERYQKAKQAETQAINNAQKYQSELKSQSGQLKILKDQNAKLVQNASSAKTSAKPNPKMLKEVTQLKAQNSKMHAKLQELTKQLQVKMQEINQMNRVTPAATQTKADSGQDEVLKRKNSELTSKVKELQDKLKKAEKGASTSSAESGSAKEKKLEQNVKKLNTELTKARNESVERKKEAMKFKTELTGLKNKMKVMEKDLEKAKKHASRNAKKKAA